MGVAIVLQHVLQSHAVLQSQRVARILAASHAVVVFSADVHVIAATAVTAAQVAAQSHAVRQSRVAQLANLVAI